MKVLRLFRVLGFKPSGKEMQRGPQARGTLVITESEDGLRAKFLRDVGDNLELEIFSYQVIPAVPKNHNIYLVQPDGRTQTFVSYKELPPVKSHFTVISAGINLFAR